MGGGGGWGGEGHKPLMPLDNPLMDIELSLVNSIWDRDYNLWLLGNWRQCHIITDYLIGEGALCCNQWLQNTDGQPKIWKPGNYQLTAVLYGMHNMANVYFDIWEDHSRQNSWLCGFGRGDSETIDMFQSKQHDFEQLRKDIEQLGREVRLDRTKVSKSVDG